MSIVMKFGGSSLATAQRIKAVVAIIRDRVKYRPVIVLSALGDTTDDLLAAGKAALRGKVDISKIKKHHQKVVRDLGATVNVDQLLGELETLLQGISLIREISPRTKDHLVSFGERLSVRIVDAYCRKTKLKTSFYDAFDIGFVSNGEFTNAEVLNSAYKQIAKHLTAIRKLGVTPLVTGFLAKTPIGEITTLGRGGSDLTASILGVCAKAKEIQFWKDVDGILSTDPRIAKNAMTLSKVSFQEAAELAYFGAKVLHPRSILPAMRAKIPVRVKNSYNPSHPGTVIVSSLDKHDRLVKSITYKKDVTLVYICSTRMLGQYGFLEKVFEVFSQYEISVDLIATSEVSLSLSLENTKNLDKVKSILSKIATVRVLTGKTIVSLVGNVKKSSRILAKTFSYLDRKNINVQMISQGASTVNISLVIDNNQANECIKGLHQVFVE